MLYVLVYPLVLAFVVLQSAQVASTILERNSTKRPKVEVAK